MYVCMYACIYRCADESLARSRRKQARKHVGEERDFNNIETPAVIKVFFPARQSTERNSRHSDRNKLACFFPGLVTDLSAHLYVCVYV